jgi:hypothetical protein
MINAARLRTAIAALRSGNYPQGRKMLRAPEGYCCLGVLTDVAIKADREIATSIGATIPYWGRCQYLPGVVRDWYGFDRANPILPTMGFSELPTVPSAYINDVMRLNFDKIADLFEQLLVTGESE